MNDEPRSAIVKIMIVDRPADVMFDFFADPRNWESGGVLRNVRQDGDWWLRLASRHCKNDFTTTSNLVFVTTILSSAVSGKCFPGSLPTSATLPFHGRF